MSFGIRGLKKKQSNEIIENQKLYFKHVIIGTDFISILQLLRLRQIHDHSQIKLILEKKLSKQSIIDDWKCTIKDIREERVVNSVVEKIPQFEFIPSDTPTVFYKDTKFHKFGDRAKPMELQEGEDRFLEPFYRYNLKSLISEDDWNQLDEIIEFHTDQRIVESIEATTPEDLVTTVHFRIHMSDNDVFECENLYWNRSPRDLFRLTSNQLGLSDAFKAYASGVEERSGVIVHFDCDRKIFNNESTIYLPQSVTHEWGHFVGVVSEYDEENSKQEATFLIYINEDEITSEEELAKKIKLLKRVMNRTLPEFEKSKYSESILYSNQMFSNNLNDELKSQIDKDHPKLKMIGHGAPVDPDKSFLSGLARSLYSL